MEPRVSVIIPSFDGIRNGNVEKLKSQLNSQTISPHEIIVVAGVAPNGKARNDGACKAKGDFLIFIDDDVTLGSNSVIENLLNPFRDNLNIGMTGASQLIPEDSNCFQKLSARQIPRSFFPVQKEPVDSDMVTHACLCIPAKLFKDIGMENPYIISGTDPDLRHRVREAGYRVCVVPDTWGYHPTPKTLISFLHSAFIKGRNSASVRLTHPELIYEVEDEFTKKFVPRKPFPIRIARIIFRMLYMLLTLKIFGFAFYMAYSIGNLYGTFAGASTGWTTDNR
ncbi:MAG: glycosyltransferase family 2 protein [Victivallales bacterium]